MQILQNNQLIPEQEWTAQINSLKTNTELKNKKEILEKLEKALINAVEKRIPKEKFGIFFSGGVDSTLIAYICKKLKKEFICYTVGLKNSTDLENAKVTAKELGFELKAKLFSLDEAEAIIKETAEILGKDYANVVNVGVGAVELACVKLAQEDNIKLFFSGLGSEEIFAGYQRHELSADINRECWFGLISMYERDLVRDYLISKKYKAKFLCPFLDKELIRLAMQVPSKYKIKNNVKKYILREAALRIGLKKEFALRKKKAAQYGSNFDKAIAKLAKINKFNYKRGYLISLLK
ncbi:asparagine synthase C-terminal domain-containing protein [Candidatus Woesearchaeota archaeon]|nr:asparagine synthase C-terminal domain-containing protein [Candidatus Woesearchaeota archaeon]